MELLKQKSLRAFEKNIFLRKHSGAETEREKRLQKVQCKELLIQAISTEFTLVKQIFSLFSLKSKKKCFCRKVSKSKCKTKSTRGICIPFTSSIASHYNFLQRPQEFPEIFIKTNSLHPNVALRLSSFQGSISSVSYHERKHSKHQVFCY